MKEYKVEGETIISFIHADKCPAQGKRDNQNEVKAIENFLFAKHIDNFCILTPYNEQIFFLRTKFPHLFKEERILTVHKSQGREWDTVFLSVCDTENMWFTDSLSQLSNGKNLINTAVSRAKKELVVVCDYNFWIKQNRQLIQGLLSIANQL